MALEALAFDLGRRSQLMRTMAGDATGSVVLRHTVLARRENPRFFGMAATAYIPHGLRTANIRHRMATIR